MNATEPAGRVVVVGTGHAGFHTAQSLREDGFTGSVALIGEEPQLPYERPPLSKGYLKGDACVEFRPSSFYRDRQIDLLVGEAVGIDRGVRQVRLADGSPVEYDHLVLATGSTARRLTIPGTDLAGVLPLRSLNDASALRDRLANARRVVVIGGGFIGLEATSAAVASGAAVEVVEAAPRLMGRAVTEPISAHLLERHRARGVAVRLGAVVMSILGSAGSAAGVQLASGEILPADVILVGVGSVPRCDLAAAAGLMVDNGIVVDDHLRTADADISAIGDCARFPVSTGGTTRHVRLESVQNAVDQARCVAARLTGWPRPYAAVPWLWSEQAGLKLQMAGLPGSHDSEQILTGRSPGRFSVLLFAGEVLVGAESVNSPADHVAVRKLLGCGRTVTRQQTCEPGADLRALAS